MKTLLAALLIASLSTFSFASGTTQVKVVGKKIVNVKTVRWEGTSDRDMLTQARADLEKAVKEKVKTLRVELISPGGPVITSLEIARLVRDASDQGLVVETHANALCASGCTFILASGTPGHRYMSKWALFFVHSMQNDGECVSRVADPQTPNDKASNVLLSLMRLHYIRYTGRSYDVVDSWLTCGNEQIGTGELAVSMGFADSVG